MVTSHPYRVALSALIAGVVLFVIASAFFNHDGDGANAVWAFTCAVLLSAAAFALYGLVTRGTRYTGPI